MMDEKSLEIAGQLSALEQQRNEALTRIVMLAGQMNVMQAKLNEAEAKVKELTDAKTADTPAADA